MLLSPKDVQELTKASGVRKNWFCDLGQVPPPFLSCEGGPLPFPPRRDAETVGKEEMGMVGTVTEMPMVPACPLRQLHGWEHGNHLGPEHHSHQPASAG